MELQLAQLGPEARVMACLPPRRLQLVQGGDKGLGDVSPAEVAVEPPATLSVGLEERVRNRRRSNRDVRAVEPGGSGPLGEESDP